MNEVHYLITNWYSKFILKSQVKDIDRDRKQKLSINFAFHEPTRDIPINFIFWWKYYNFCKSPANSQWESKLPYKLFDQTIYFTSKLQSRNLEFAMKILTSKAFFTGYNQTSSAHLITTTRKLMAHQRWIQMSNRKKT